MNDLTVHALRKLVQLEVLPLVFLMEMKLQNHKATKLKDKLGYHNSSFVECKGQENGRVGGLGLLWSDAWQVEVV